MKLKAQNEQSALIRHWKDKSERKTNLLNQRGNSTLPCDWLTPPEVDIAARGRDKEQVKTIKKSMESIGVHSPRVWVLVWADDVKAAGYDPENLILPATDRTTPPFPMYVIVGSHTCAAIQELHQQYPRNRMYKSVEVESFLVSARNDTTAEYAQSAGTMDNFVMSLQKGATAFDCINQMHTKYVATFDNASTDMTTKKEQWKRYRTKCEMGMRFSFNTIGSMMVLAGVRPELWANIEKIFKGEVEDNPDIKQRKPDTHGHFVNMSEIPFNKLMDWTGRVVLGQINTKMFNDKCLLYKKVLRVQGDCIEHVNSKRPGVNPRFENFNDMAEEYTCFAD